MPDRPLFDIVADFGTALARLEQRLEPAPRLGTYLGDDTPPFAGDRQARAALSAWLLDGADILRRCRVEGHDQGYCRDTLAEFAMTALLHFDRYQGRARDPLERDALREQIERELAEAEARR